MNIDCDMPYCKSAGLLGYCGHWLCATHWAQIANEPAGSPAERELLAKLGLERDSEGIVRKLEAVR